MTHQVMLDYREDDLYLNKSVNADGDVVLDFKTPSGKTTILMSAERFAKMAAAIGRWEAKRELDEALNDNV